MDYFYHGKPCKRCGGTARYTNSRGCMHCHSTRAAQKEGAIKTVTQFVEGSPCKNCGSTKKYAKGRSCVACTLARKEQRAEKRKEKQLVYEKAIPGKEPCKGCGEFKTYHFRDYCRKCLAQQRKGWRIENKEFQQCMNCGEWKSYTFKDYCRKCQAAELKRREGKNIYSIIRKMNQPF
ncbi:hypothetical protein ABE356_000218 [Escherichia coli]|nr:hypothetical protein [Escherichia coli]